MSGSFFLPAPKACGELDESIFSTFFKFRRMKVFLKLKLYKFRPLLCLDDFCRVKEILETGSFYCSLFSELNDPMEGAFMITKNANTEEIIRRIYAEKQGRRICSFSGENGFKELVMWGYYAGGFKGVAVEVEVDVQAQGLKPVTYKQKMCEIEKDFDVEKILTTKLRKWKHENEYRFLTDSEKKKVKIGKVKTIYFGEPFKYAQNADDIYQKNNSLLQYEDFKEHLNKSAQSEDVDVRFVGLNDSGVVVRKKQLRRF